MKVVIPMAGMGTRMRPHTLTIPKPLLPIAGKPIVQRLVEEIAQVVQSQIDEIAFIIGDFGTEVENRLIAIAEALGAKGSIFYQCEALGTAHAIHCATSVLEGPVIVAFADTLFKADFTIDPQADGSIWVKQIEDPKSFGVVSLDSNGVINDFVEKPQEFVSDLAIIGIYYFKQGEILKSHIQRLIDEKITVKGEYQLTDALKSMQLEGLKLLPGTVTEWLDCGNKDATVYTNQRILELTTNEQFVDPTSCLHNSILIPPVYIGANVCIKNSVIGPHVSIGEGTKVRSSVIKNSIIQTKCHLTGLVTENTMIGNFVTIQNKYSELNVGDYTQMV